MIKQVWPESAARKPYSRGYRSRKYLTACLGQVYGSEMYYSPPSTWTLQKQTLKWSRVGWKDNESNWGADHSELFQVATSTRVLISLFITNLVEDLGWLYRA